MVNQTSSYSYLDTVIQLVDVYSHRLHGEVAIMIFNMMYLFTYLNCNYIILLAHLRNYCINNVSNGEVL